MGLPLLSAPNMFTVLNVTSRSFDVEFEYPFFLEGQTVSEFIIEFEEHSATIGHDETPLDSMKRRIHVSAPRWLHAWEAQGQDLGSDNASRPGTVDSGNEEDQPG